MHARPQYGGAAQPATLREVNGLGFLHRERSRFAAGASELLGVTLAPRSGEGFIVDCAAVRELYGVAVAAGGTAMIGAFATVNETIARASTILPVGTTAEQARLRLALLDARVTVLGIGRNRTASFDALELKPYELPTTIEVAAPKPGFGLAERRRTTRDGEASHSVGVCVALRISVLGRFEGVRVVVDVDGEMRRAGDAETRLDRQRVQPESLNEAARMAAATFPAIDARSSAIARTLVPLAFAALRDAAADARATIVRAEAETQPRRGTLRR